VRPAVIESRKARRSHRWQFTISRAALILVAALFFVISGARVSLAAQSQTSSQFASRPGKSPSKKKSTKSRTRGQAAPTPDRIREIQQALSKSGNYKGQPTGKLDVSTLDALKSFQSAQNLPATGKLDARTLQKLGLGSETAGSAAPKTVVTPPASK
jgi:peptidoglycan hydrolase-like protein with peptidoglycan-binding domain